MTKIRTPVTDLIGFSMFITDKAEIHDDALMQDMTPLCMPSYLYLSAFL